MEGSYSNVLLPDGTVRRISNKVLQRASEAQGLALPLTLPSGSSFTKSDHRLLINLGFRVAIPTLSQAVKFLEGLKDEKLLAAMNILFFERMNAMNSLSEGTKNILYNFIDQGLSKLIKEDRDKFLLIMPILSMRYVDVDDTDSLLEKSKEFLDRRLMNIFERHVTKVLALNDLSLALTGNISSRLRAGLNINLNLNPTITEMYEIADNSGTESVRQLFFNEFMINFYFEALPIVVAMSQQTPLVPGINTDATLSSIVKIMNEFNNYVDLNDN
jgi:hypothetical protein